MARDLATADDAAAVGADLLLALFEGGANPVSEDPVMQAVRDVVATVLTDPPANLTANQRETFRELLGLAHVPAADRVAATSQVLRAFSPADIREIAHNQAVRPLPNNGTEVETLRMYYGDDAAWDEEIYVCIQDHILSTDSRPEEGEDWETYFVKVTTRVKQVSTLPAPADVTDRDLGKLHIVRADHDGLPSALAHVAEVDDEKLGALAAGSDGSGRNGFINEAGSDARGHLTGYAGITRLDEILHTGGQHQLLLHVTEDSEIPREDTPKLVFLREQESTDDWWEITVINGADGSYESQGYSGARSIEAGKVYDVYIRPIAQSSAIRVQTSNPTATNRYDFFPDSRTWAVFSEDSDTGQHAVIIRELAAGPVIPDAPAGSDAADRRMLIGAAGAYALIAELYESMVPDLPASKITSGTLATSRIPGLSAAFIVSGAFAEARIPASIARVANIPAATPANRLIPAGGDDGQVLGKASDNDFATEWIDAAMGAAAQAAASTETEAPKAFYATLVNKADVQANSFADAAASLEIMEIADADIEINEGGFTVETTSNVSEIVIPLTGLYMLGVHMTFGSAASRTTTRGRFKLTRGADVTYGVIATGGYLRGAGTYSGDIASLDFTQPVNLQAGDKLTVQVINQSDDQLNLAGTESFIWLLKEEGPLSANDGFVVNVSGSPPTATAETIRHVYQDVGHDPPKVWIGYQKHDATTPATADSELVAAGGNGTGYRGGSYSSPFPATNGDWFWDRQSHAWQYRSGGRFLQVSFAELKTNAMNSAGDALFFGENDVFLNEVISANQAAGIMDNAGGEEDDVDYWAIIAGSFYEITDFVAAIGEEDLFGFYELGELVAPLNEQSDDSLTAPVGDSQWLTTSVRLPGGSWGFIKFVGITDSYFRFYVPELDDKDDATNGEVGTDDERITLRLWGERVSLSGVTAAGLMTLASNLPVSFWPTQILVRTN